MNNYKTLIKTLKDFEKDFKNARLTTDEMSDILDQIRWLEDVGSNMETSDD
jgi:hypothetical protein